MRLDSYLTEEKKFSSRSKAQFAIKNKQVLVNGKIAKASQEIGEFDSVEILPSEHYVSLGKFKLKKAVEDFSYSIKDKIVCDVGASTGGFTELMLELGAKKVYAVDIGENQLDLKLRKDDRIVVLDKTNAKSLTKDMFSDTIDLIVVDVSFISLRHILPACKNILKPGGDIIALIKPQFEAGKRHLNKQGIVKDIKIREQVLSDVIEFAKGLQLVCADKTTAPFRGKEKNLEYLCLFRSVL